MVLTGTIVNSAAVAGGTVVGLVFKRGLKENVREITNQGLGLSVLFIGISTTLSGLLNPESKPLLFIISLVLGGVLGELWKIEYRLEKLGDRLKDRMGEGHGKVSEAFVTATLIYCVGSMTILGSLQSGLENRHDILYAKSILDGICSVILASSLGIGVIFSALAVLVYQGALSLLASFIGPYATEEIIREIGIVGGIMIFSIGINILELKRIRTGNFLPALLIPPVWLVFLQLTGKA
ncbi:MAG: DUF554 domain-containing protein [Spirochaetales bacterium]|nr:DUF554 domain-containing protein [Spirochaetales bacterium]